MEKKYSYLGYILLLLLPLIFFAFYYSYFKGFPHASERIRYFDHIHAALAMCWVLLLIVQPLLVKYRQFRWHRLLGRISYIVFPLFILSFLPRMVLLYQGDSRDLFSPLADTMVMVPLYILAIYHKRNTGYHMRYMIGSSLVLLGPTIGRIGYAWMDWTQRTTQHVQYGIIYTLLILLILYDGRKSGKAQPYLITAALFIGHQLLYYMFYF